MAKVVFLGTNGWYDSSSGSTICTLIDTKECYIILDAGYGIHRADTYITEDKPVYLLLSHYHLDHIAGLHVLNKFRLPSGLFIIGQPGTKDILSRIICKPFTIPLCELPFEAKVVELQEGDHQQPIQVSCRYLVHASPCFGYRIQLEGKSIAYCPDTGFCDSALQLAGGVDLLISECAHLPGESNPLWPHMNPQEACDLATKAGARKLVLTHFDAARYPTVARRKEAAGGVTGLVRPVVSEDGMIIEV
jgi:ribonuclease BN (tRNA processing enzyme)